MISKTDFIKSISSELKILRVENDDLQDDLSKKSGVASSTISKYESGLCSMSIEKIEQIIRPYNIDLYIFFNRILAKTHKE